MKDCKVQPSIYLPPHLGGNEKLTLRSLKPTLVEYPGKQKLQFVSPYEGER
jgi:hypothetical protein